MATFVQGFLAVVTIDGTDTTPITANVGLARSRTVLDKSVMDGTGFASSIPGMLSGTLAFDGHISQAELNTLEVSYAKDIPVTFAVEINEGLSTDGAYAGSFTFETLDVETSADGNWAFSAGGPTSGAIVYTRSNPV